MCLWAKPVPLCSTAAPTEKTKQKPWKCSEAGQSGKEQVHWASWAQMEVNCKHAHHTWLFLSLLCHTPLTEREEASWLCCFWLIYAAWYRQDINPTSLFQLSGVMVKTSLPSLKWSGLRLRLRWASCFSHVESVWRPPPVLFWPHPAVHLSELPISFSSLFHFPFHPPPNGFPYRISVISIIPAFICLLSSNAASVSLRSASLCPHSPSLPGLLRWARSSWATGAAST